MARRSGAESLRELEELTQFDSLLEHRVRLAICVLLARNDAVSFGRFKALLVETDGSLGAHLRKLEDAEYITVERTYQGRRPISWYRLTPTGRRQLERHVDGLQILLERRR